MYNTVWTRNVRLPEHPALSGRVEADACVIGGGLCGVLTACKLRRERMKVVLLEAERLGGGTTCRTTGKLTAQHGLCYARLIDKMGGDMAKLYADAQLHAIGEYRRMGIGLRDCTTWLYATGEEGAEDLRREYEAAKACGLDATLKTGGSLPFPTSAALGFGGQATIHPLEAMAAAAEGLEIYERSRVTEVEGNRIITEKGEVNAEIVVFCSRFPFVNFPGFYFMRMHQERDYVLELHGKHGIAEPFLGIEETGVSLRPVGEDVLLLGGESHRTGDGKSGRYDRLRDFAAKWFPDLEERAAWSAEDCMTLDGLPYVGRFAPTAPEGWFVAAGFGKWGMSNSMAAAEIIADLAAGRESRYAAAFDPGRFKPSAGASRLMEETAHSIGGLAKGMFGDKPRCPHLGCELEWNEDEQSWDCPCHGSRFDAHGSLLDGPAQTGIAAEPRE